MEKLVIAHLTKTHGLKGEIKGILLTSFPEDRFIVGNKFFLKSKKSNNEIEVTLASFKEVNGAFYFKFDELPTINEVEQFENSDLLIDKELATLPKDTYRFSDLIGCEVFNSKTKEILGKVKDVLDYAPVKTMRICRENGKDFFIPFHHSFVGDIDLESKKIEIFVVEGML